MPGISAPPGYGVAATLSQQIGYGWLDQELFPRAFLLDANGFPVAPSKSTVTPGINDSAGGYDAVIYGSTIAGILSAQTLINTAIANGRTIRVALLSESSNVGGMPAEGGLGTWDTHGNMSGVTGDTWSFLAAVGVLEGVYINLAAAGTACPTTLPPAIAYGQSKNIRIVAENILAEMEAFGYLVVYRNCIINSPSDVSTGVDLYGNKIITGFMTNQGFFTAAIMHDATYDGDLMCGAGCLYTYGRESSAPLNDPTNTGAITGQGYVSAASLGYGEAAAGFQTPVLAFDPTALSAPFNATTNANGQPLYPAIPDYTTGLAVGTGDARIMADSYRHLIVKTGNAPFGIKPFTAPPTYQDSEYALTLAMAVHLGPTTLSQIIAMPSPSPNGGKICINKANPYPSTELCGHNWDTIEASPGERIRHSRKQAAWQRGLLYWAAFSPDLPANGLSALQADAQLYGYPADENVNTQNFPTLLYKRERRRMIGTFVLTQANTTTTGGGPNVFPSRIGKWAYAVDTHPKSLVLVSGVFKYEGAFVTTPSAATYQIPFYMTVPRQQDCTNLFVSVCCSASHVAWCSTRNEIAHMMRGVAVGYAMWLYLSNRQGPYLSVPVQQTNIAALQALLTANNNVIV
jgi:hypothetical protein